MYIDIPKDSQNVDKSCTFSSLVSSYIRLCAMNDKSKTTLVSDLVVCGSSYQTRATLSYDMRPNKQTQSIKSSCSTHKCGLLIVLPPHT